MQAPDMPSVTVFGLERSVYTRIARLALEEKGVPYNLQEVEIFGAGGVPAEHRARHPFGRIPVLKHGEFELFETTAITRYVDEAFPGPSLQPQEATARGRMNQIIGIIDGYAYRPMIWGVFVQRVSIPESGGSADEAGLAAALDASRQCLDALEQIAAPGSFLVGNALTLADLHTAPLLIYLALTPEGEQLLEQHQRLRAWLRSIMTRASVVRTRSVYERTRLRPPT